MYICGGYVGRSRDVTGFIETNVVLAPKRLGFRV